MVLKQDDVQLILNQLMGLPLEVTDDFEFDEDLEDSYEELAKDLVQDYLDKEKESIQKIKKFF